MITADNRLTNLQLEMLKLFHYQLDEAQLNEVKEMLSTYFSKKIDEGMDKVWQEKNWTNETMDNILNDHPRVPYSK